MKELIVFSNSDKDGIYMVFRPCATICDLQVSSGNKNFYHKCHTCVGPFRYASVYDFLALRCGQEPEFEKC